MSNESSTHEDGSEQATWNPALRPNAEKQEEEYTSTVGVSQSPEDGINQAAISESLQESTTEASEPQRSPSRHFAQSASIHQIAEVDETDNLAEETRSFDELPRQGIDYTNSFPAFEDEQPHAALPTHSEPLPRSQAEGIVADQEAAAVARNELELASAEAAVAADGVEWNDDANDDFLADSIGQLGEAQGIEQLRFEEGVPLMKPEQESKDPVSADVNWGESKGDDDFFDPSKQEETAQFSAKPLERKSTEQVLDAMHLRINGSHEKIKITPSDLPGNREPDLAAAWSEALGDDDLLVEDYVMDPSAFFEDDGEGFLEEPSSNQTVTNGAQDHTAVQRHSNVASTSSQSSSAKAISANYSALDQSSKPEASRTQSFADKAKGGYVSPYDLPMDLRPKRQAALRQASGTIPSLPQPPPRGASFPSPGPQSSPFASGQPSPGIRSINSQAKPAAFFEELPITAKPARPASAARFNPASPPIGPPQSVQAPPPRPNAPSNPPNPTFNHGLVMPARTLSFGEESMQQPSTAHIITKVTNRYSPAPAAQAPNAIPVSQGRYASAPVTTSPTGPPRATSANYAAPFQPRTSSPLARSTSISAGNADGEISSKGLLTKPGIDERTIDMSPPQISSSARRASLQSVEKPYRRPSDNASQPPLHHSTNTVVRHRRTPSLIKQYFPPGDGRAQDPLERWKGGPIFKFGSAGIITSFPVETPRYSVGQTQPLYIVNPGEIKVRNSKTICILDESLLSFPGPLKNKGKKKELLAWLVKRIHFLKEQLAITQDRFDPASARREEDRITLLQVLNVLVECDGNFETNAAAIASLRQVLVPLPQADSRADVVNYGSEVAPGITRSNIPPPSHTTDVEAIEQIRKYLLLGDREKAVWHAVDRNLWGHAMLIASTLQGDTWKQVVHEFVRSEVKASGNSTEALSALYDVFSGNWEESVDQLVPAAARSGFQMVSKTGSSSIQDALTGLDKWQETLALILNNRTNGDVKALIALGELLAGYGRAEAAHTCYVLAKIPGLLSASDEPTAHAVLLGVNHRQQLTDFHKDTDAIIVTEIYEFVTNVLAGGAAAQPMQYLAAYKLQHALALSDVGRREEAQAYCEVIATSIKANKTSPYMHAQLIGALDDLVNRLSQAPKELSKSWLPNPKMGDVSSSLLNRFNKFVSGDDGDAASNASGPGIELGPFGAIAGEPISISRTASPAMVASGYGTQSGYATSIQAPGASSRYAPAGSSYSSSPGNSIASGQHRESSGSLPRMSPDHFRKIHPSTYQSSGSYAPTSGLAAAPQNYGSDTPRSVPSLSAPLQSPSELHTAISDGSRPSTSESISKPPLQGRRTSYEPLNVPKPANRDRNSSAYQPRSSGPESRSSSYAPRSGSYAPRSYAPSPATSERRADDASRQSSASYVPQAPLSEMPEAVADASDIKSSEAVSSMNDHNPGSESKVAANEELSVINEAPISFGGFDPAPSYGYQPADVLDAQQANGHERASVVPLVPIHDQSLDSHEVSASDRATDIASYEPAAYSGYEPPSTDFQPYETSFDAESEDKPKKKKGIMDLSDEDDDVANKAVALKKEEKARKDREAEEAFRRAAEEDAKRDSFSKSAGNRGSWFGGWLGGKKKETGIGGPEPTVHKAKLGEESSFVYDETLKKWVNKKVGAEDLVEKKATPPPPRAGPPSRSASAGPPVGGPPRSVSASGPGLGIGAAPPSRTQSPLVNMTTAAEAARSNAVGHDATSGTTSISSPLATSETLTPPSRPATAMSSIGSSGGTDDIFGGPAPGARRGAAAKKGKKGGRYVDIMAK